MKSKIFCSCLAFSRVSLCGATRLAGELKPILAYDSYGISSSGIVIVHCSGMNFIRAIFNCCLNPVVGQNLSQNIVILYSLLTDGIVLVFVKRWGKNESRGESI